jgi:DNA adenine methylase
MGKTKDTKYISSPMNYIGGKYKLLPQLFPLFPEKVNTFVDLFCGGANVGVNAKAESILFNDNLIYLIDLYKTFLNNKLDETIYYIEKRIDEFGLSLSNQEGYLKLRNEYNTNRNPLDLFVLVAFSFNHQIRFNNSHQFNCPFGKDRSCYNPNIKYNLVQFINAIKEKNVQFISQNFDEFNFTQLKPGDYVYADPPYLITIGSYNDGKRGFTGWNELAEEKLLSILDDLNHKNINFGLSNVLYHKGKSNSILIDWIEKNEYRVNYLNKDYSNCNYHTLDKSKDASVEVLVTNYIPTDNELKLWP